MYISNAGVVVVTQGTPQWYPGNLKSYTYISNAGVVVVTQGTPNGTQATSNPICTLVMQESSLSPRVLPNGTQATSILCRTEYFYDCLGTIGEYPGWQRPLRLYSYNVATLTWHRAVVRRRVVAMHLFSLSVEWFLNWGKIHCCGRYKISEERGLANENEGPIQI